MQNLDILLEVTQLSPQLLEDVQAYAPVKGDVPPASFTVAGVTKIIETSEQLQDATNEELESAVSGQALIEYLQENYLTVDATNTAISEALDNAGFQDSISNLEDAISEIQSTIIPATENELGIVSIFLSGDSLQEAIDNEDSLEKAVSGQSLFDNYQTTNQVSALIVSQATSIANAQIAATVPNFLRKTPEPSVFLGKWYNFDDNGSNYGLDEITARGFMGGAAITPIAITQPWTIIPLPAFGKVLIASEAANGSALYDIAAGTLTALPSHPANLGQAVLAPFSGLVYFNRFNSQDVYVYNPATNTFGTVLSTNFTVTTYYPSRPVLVPKTSTQTEKIWFYNHKNGVDNEEIATILDIVAGTFTKITNDGAISPTNVTESGAMSGCYVESTNEVWSSRYWASDITVATASGTITHWITNNVATYIKYMCYNKATNRVFVAGGHSNSPILRAYDPVTKLMVDEYYFGNVGELRDMTFNKNNGLLYVQRINNKMAIFDPWTLTLIKEVACTAGSNFVACSFEPITKTVFASQLSSNRVLVLT